MESFGSWEVRPMRPALTEVVGGELSERNLRRKRQWQENPPSTASSDGDVINDGYYGNDATMDELVMRFEHAR
eukprot:CCRYP_017750-RA/>CCRYP_017750-RA protein AED:0.40 eAED:1.00 QI:0/-1/0/1/-1/1/1/0/72